jgi:hypothetical protein
VAGLVEGTPEEGGEYPFRVTLTDPSGEETELGSSDSAELPGQTDDPDLPVTLVFAINFFRTYAEPGRYVIRAEFGDLREEYAFMVAPKRRARPRATAERGRP